MSAHFRLENVLLLCLRRAEVPITILSTAYGAKDFTHCMSSAFPGVDGCKTSMASSLTVYKGK